ncbi:MAG TPA: fluoride efflux transporter CrcB [Chitinophagaceae bacterium]
MITQLAWVALGGAVGSVLRYGCSRALNVGAFPFGTLLVNVLGCLAIGLLWGVFTRHTNEALRLLLVTGFCGGFTTFSTFTYEGIQLMQEGRWTSFIVYTAFSVTLGLAATFLGFKLTS